MKKLLVTVGLIASMHCMYAQKSVYTELPDRLFTQGKEMFNDNNYTACINLLEEFRTKTKDEKKIAEADYMIISSLFYQRKANAEFLLKEYLEKYPETYHRNQISFFIGTVHFDQKDWKKALYWFNQSDMDYLVPGEQEDYVYRSAYANLQEGNRSEAKRLFSILNRTSNKYGISASYYLAYINFQEGEYEKALPVFRSLKSRNEYKENATFFLMQGAYANRDLQETISEGRDFISTYPASTNLAEVYRLLGTSYYQTGDLNNAINNYEQYLAIEVNPFREDMYQLGEAYYQLGMYPKSIEALKKAASSFDLLGQAASLLLGQAYLKVNDNTNALLSFDAATRGTFNKNISEDALFNYAVLVNKESVSAFDQSITASQRFLREYPGSKYTDQINELLATTLLSTTNYSTALDVINTISSPGRQILEAKQMILCQLGVQEFINGNYDAALQNFNACINMGSYNEEARNEAYFWRGESAYQREEFGQAAGDYSSYLSQASSYQKNYALALYNLGYANYQLKDYSNAQSNFRKYISAESNRQSPTYADALNRIGDSYLYSRNFAEAERYYAQAVSANPSNADYSEFQRAFVMGLQRNYTGKVTALDNMMAKYPNSSYYADAMFEKSRALVMLNREKDAISVLEKLLRDFPRTNLGAQAGVQLGQLYFNTNNPQKSIESYKRVVSNYPNTEESRISIQSLEGVYKDINDINSYVNYVNSLGGAMRLSAGRQDSLTYQAAENAYIRVRKEEAKNSYNTYLQSYPNGIFSSDAQFYLGLNAFENNDKDRALAYFKEVINSNNPKYIDNALIYASGIEFDKGNYQDAYGAYEHLNMVASTSENKDIAQLGMLRCAYLLNKDTDVITAANRLIDNNKTSPNVATEARFYRAKAYANSGQSDEAAKDLQIVAADTRNAFGAEAQYMLADTYYKWKSYDRAEKQVLDFMKQGTPHEYWLARAVIVLSDVYVAKGDRFQAQQYLESLKANYKGTEQDIANMISERLAVLNN